MASLKKLLFFGLSSSTIAELTQLNFTTDCIPVFPTESRTTSNTDWIGQPFCKETVESFGNRVIVEFQLNHFGWGTEGAQKILEIGTQNERSGFLLLFIPKDAFYPAIRFHMCEDSMDMDLNFDMSTDEWLYEIPLNNYMMNRPVEIRVAVVIDQSIADGTRVIMTGYDPERLKFGQDVVFYQEVKHNFFPIDNCGQEISIGHMDEDAPYNGQIRNIKYMTSDVVLNSPEDWSMISSLWRPWDQL